MTAPHEVTQWWSATTSWRAIRCRASAFPVSQPSVPPQGRADNAGTLAHLALQRWIESKGWKRSDPGVALQRSFDEAAAAAAIDWRRLPNGVVTRARLKARAHELGDTLREAEGEVHCEQLLTDNEEHLYGVLDVVSSGTGGLIVDLKTGHAGSKEPPPMVLHQMTFYAHLFAAVYGVLPTRSVVFSLQRGPIAISVDAASVGTLLRDLRTAREKPEYATSPSAEVCRFCPRRMTCKAHWERVPTWSEPDAIEGIVSKIEKSTSGTFAILISGSWVTGLTPPMMPKPLLPGVSARVVRIRRLTDTAQQEWTSTRLTEVRVV